MAERAGLAVVVDVHEPAAIEAYLGAKGVPTRRQKLQPADYVIGDAAVERKTTGDFFNSLVRKRLFDQVSRLREAYPEPYLLLEGDLAEFAERRNSAAVWGALVRIVARMRVPVLPSPSLEESARYLYVLWRAQAAKPAHGGIRFKPPRFASPEEEQRFVLEGLPFVGEVGAHRLLEHFGSVRGVLAASEADLLRVPLVGEVKARLITALLDRAYPRRDARLPEGR